MFDLKPDAPAEVRGEFKPIATNVPGVQICEHLPRTAKWMHKAALVRSRQPQGRLPQLPAELHRLRSSRCPTSTRATPTRRAWARCASTCGSGRGELPDYVYMPCWLGWGQAFRRAGPYAGFLGQRYDPLTTECSPYADPGDDPDARQAGDRPRRAAAAEQPRSTPT